ncbi:MAG: HEAT repeat domain-containing protein [Phycisphaeraceae bacterium]|nr:HEAT repeat domain-containing protein [Phycisphaeraceae bacterium]
MKMLQNGTSVLGLCLFLSFPGCGSDGDPTEQDWPEKPEVQSSVPEPTEVSAEPEPEPEPQVDNKTENKKTAQEIRREKMREEARLRREERARQREQRKKLAAERYMQSQVSNARLLLASGDPAQRTKGLRMLKGLHDERVLELMLLVLNDSDHRLAAEAQFMLGQWGDKTVTSALWKEATTGDIDRRVAAIKALGLCHHRHVPKTKLVNLFTDPSVPSRVRAAAAEATGRLLMWSALEPLTDALKDSERAVRAGAYRGISMLLDKRMTFQPEAAPENRNRQADQIRAYWQDPKRQPALRKSILDRQASEDRVRGYKP